MVDIKSHFTAKMKTETKMTEARSLKEVEKIDFEASFQNHGLLIIQMTFHFHSHGV